MTLVCLALWASPGSGAGAQAPAGELMAEPAQYTDVIDASDGTDPFDLDVRVGFARERVVGMLERESVATPGGQTRRVRVAQHQRTRNVLKLGLNVGLMRDLMLYSRLPLILSDERSLRLAAGQSSEEVRALLRHPVPPGYHVRNPPGSEPPEAWRARRGRLFEVGYRSPTRSGVDWLGFGLAWGVTNQFRRADLPTWVVMLEGRFGIGPSLFPGRGPAVSRGVHALRLETRTSYRKRDVEPYAGLALEFQWPAANRELFGTSFNDVRGAPSNRPPRQLQAALGLAVVPWDNRARFQRILFDLRLFGAHYTEGRDYSPLFDVLGGSQSPYLTQPGPDEAQFRGVTDISDHARVGIRAGVLVQAARYVRFALGASLAYDTAYWITGSEPCWSGVQAPASDPRPGVCGTGVANPHHRAVIDQPGQRFLLRGQSTLVLYGTATGSF